MADQDGLCEGATKRKPTRYVIYFIHDLHGYLDGIPGRAHEDAWEPNHGRTLRRMGGIKAIARLLEGWRKTDWQQGQVDGVFVCLGGDMVCEYRSRKLDKSNVKEVWKYILEQTSPDAWVLGNHELDPEYADSLLEMIRCKPETCCTRNLLWADTSGDCPVGDEDCLHQDQGIPLWSQHVPNDAADRDPKPVVFTGLTVAKAGWRPDGYRKIPDKCKFVVKKDAQEKDWRKLCKRFAANWKKADPIYYLIKHRMNDALVEAVQAVAEGDKGELPDEHKTQIFYIANKMLRAKVLHFDNRDVFSSIVAEGDLSPEAKDLSEKDVNDLTDSEAMFLNASLLRPAFAPALICSERHKFRVLAPESLIERLKQPPRKEGCRRGDNGFLHVHIAHFGDMSPEEFGGPDGPWLKTGPGFGLPVVLLKAHDHRISPDSCEQQGGDEQSGSDPGFQRIPTFEAGRNGAVFGKLTVTVTPRAPKCDWQVLYPGKAIDFEKREFPRIGVSPNGNAGSYPIVAQDLDFARMGGSPFDSDELYRAVTLLLRSGSRCCRDDRCLIVACPSLVIADSRIEESDLANGGRIDLFDVGHVFGHREELRTLTIRSEKDLMDGILKALGSAYLGASPLPPMSGGLPVPGHGTWADALPYWYLPEAMCPADVAVGRVLCLRWRRKEYLAVSPPASKDEEIDRQRIGLYELMQSDDEYKPVFRCRLTGQTIDTLAGHLEIRFPLTICVDRFLAKRCSWHAKSIPVEDGKLMRVIADYVRDCADSKRGLWRP